MVYFRDYSRKLGKKDFLSIYLLIILFFHCYVNRMHVVADSNPDIGQISEDLLTEQNSDPGINQPRNSLVDDYNSTIWMNSTESYEEELFPCSSYTYEFDEEINTRMDISLYNLSYSQVDRVNGLEKWEVYNNWNTYGVVNQNLYENSSDDSLEFYASGEGDNFAVQFDLLNISGLAVPNMYSNPTTISFRTRLLNANADLLNNIYAITLMINFNSSSGKKSMLDFVISYSENYPNPDNPMVEYSGINTSLTPPPTYKMQFWVSSGLSEDWIDVNVNVTDFLTAFMDPAQYPEVSDLFQSIESINLFFECVNNFNFNATLLIENLKIESLISNGGNNLLEINGEQTTVNGIHFSRDFFSEQISINLNPDIYPYLIGNIELSIKLYRQIDFSILRSRINNSLGKIILKTSARQIMDNSSFFEMFFIAPDSWVFSYDNLSKSSYYGDPYFSSYGLFNSYFLPEIIAFVANGILDLSITSLDSEGIININGICQEATGNLYLLLNGSPCSVTPPLINSSFFFINVEIPADIIAGDLEITVEWNDSWYYGEYVLIINRNEFLPEYMLIIDAPQSVYCFDAFRINLTVYRDEMLLENLTVYYTGDFGEGIFHYKESVYSASILSALNGSYGELVIEVISSDNQIIRERININLISGECYVSLDTPYTDDVVDRNYPFCVKAQTGIIYSDTTEKNLSFGHIATLIGNFSLESVNVGVTGLTWINFIPAQYIDDSVDLMLVKCDFIVGDEIFAATSLYVSIASHIENDDQKLHVAISRMNHTPILTNSTYEEEFSINYTSSGDSWISPLPYVYGEVKSVFIENNGSFIPVGINETHIYWKGLRETGETEIMIFSLYSPLIYIDRDIIEATPPKALIHCHISLVSSLDGIIVTIPLTAEECTGNNWIIFDFRGNDITNSLDVEIIDAVLSISSFSGIMGSIINMTIVSELIPLTFETEPFIPAFVEAKEGNLLISGNITSCLPIYVFCNINYSGNPIQALLLTEKTEDYLWFYTGSLNGFRWNSSAYVSVTVRDSAGNVINSSVFTVTIVDTIIPIITTGIAVGESNITFFADSMDTGSGIKNISALIIVNDQLISFTNSSGVIEYSLCITNITYLEYYFIVFDYAENIEETPKRNITFFQSETVNNSVHFINTFLVSGTLLLGGIISVNRVVQRKRILEDV